MDGIPETKQFSEEHKQHRAAQDARYKIMDEIGNLPKESFDINTSIYVGMQLLAKTIEVEFLEVKDNQSQMNPNNHPLRQKKLQDEIQRNKLGELNQIISESREGNLISLRQLIQKTAQSEKEALEFSDGTDKELEEQTKRDIENLNIVAGLIPDTGDVSKINLIPPTNVKEDLPLNVLLDKYLQEVKSDE